MDENYFVSWGKKNNVTYNDEAFIVALAGAFIDYDENEIGKKQKEVVTKTFVTNFGEEVGITSIEGKNRSEFDKIIKQYEALKDDETKWDIDEMLISLYKSNMFLPLKEKF